MKTAYDKHLCYKHLIKLFIETDPSYRKHGHIEKLNLKTERKRCIQ